ncbi:MAG: hypothetical protein NC543_01095 [bacterium]|nr:hypothetical protein [bacterium]MCM1375056.1 hypothetical protein [Muribaculum sp.]
MAIRIDELLKQDEYDIYHDRDISDEAIETIAQIIVADKSIDLNEYFDVLKCSSKFCWLNFLYILEKMPEEDKIRGIDVLFELLQDENWPTFHQTIALLETINPQVIEHYLNRYLAQAYAEHDEMWISGMQVLVKRLEQKGYHLHLLYDLESYSWDEA